MPKIIGVNFRNVGKVYYFDPGELDCRLGDHVIVETSRGKEYLPYLSSVTPPVCGKQYTMIRNCLSTDTIFRRNFTIFLRNMEIAETHVRFKPEIHFGDCGKPLYINASRGPYTRRCTPPKKGGCKSQKPYYNNLIEQNCCSV